MSLFYQSLDFTQFNHLINIHIHSSSNSLFYLLYFINFFTNQLPMTTSPYIHTGYITL